MTDRPVARWKAIVLRRCPRCRIGAIFNGVWTMLDACEQCHLKYEREPGYFLGAMYFSYALGVLLAAPGTLYLWSRGLSELSLFGLIVAQVVVALPLVVPHSRVLWLHLDQFWDPR